MKIKSDEYGVQKIYNFNFNPKKAKFYFIFVCMHNFCVHKLANISTNNAIMN